MDKYRQSICKTAVSLFLIGSHGNGFRTNTILPWTSLSDETRILFPPDCPPSERYPRNLCPRHVHTITIIGNTPYCLEPRPKHSATKRITTEVQFRRYLLMYLWHWTHTRRSHTQDPGYRDTLRCMEMVDYVLILQNYRVNHTYVLGYNAPSTRT